MSHLVRRLLTKAEVPGVKKRKQKPPFVTVFDRWHYDQGNVPPTIFFIFNHRECLVVPRFNFRVSIAKQSSKVPAKMQFENLH